MQQSQSQQHSSNKRGSAASNYQSNYQTPNMCLPEELIWNPPSSVVLVLKIILSPLAIIFSLSFFASILFLDAIFKKIEVIYTNKEENDLRALLLLLLNWNYNWFYFGMAMFFLVLFVIQLALSLWICRFFKQMELEARANDRTGDGQGQDQGNNGNGTGNDNGNAVPNNTPNCDICFEPFATDPTHPHAPVAGHCGHIFCSSCLVASSRQPEWVFVQPETILGTDIIRVLEQHNFLPERNPARQQQQQQRLQQQHNRGFIRCYKCQQYSFPIPLEGNFKALYAMCEIIADFQKLALKAEAENLAFAAVMISFVLAPVLFACFLGCLWKQDIVSNNHPLIYWDIIYVTVTTAAWLILLSPIWMVRDFVDHFGNRVHTFQLFISCVFLGVIFAYAWFWVVTSIQKVEQETTYFEEEEVYAF